VTLSYIDVCSGISAPTMAWKPLGWKALCFADIAPFPCAVLAHHYPDVPLRSDFTEIRGDEYGPVDLLVGGTPCQSFSVAGLRGGMADERGQLALEFLRLADCSRTRWVVWENVPGVLSSNGGRDFGAFLGGLVELGYGFAYRVLDAQHFGVPQRRRRVFVVGHLGDWRRAAAVLFERHSLSGDTPPRREKGQGSTEGVAGSLGSRGNKSHTELDGHGAYIPEIVGQAMSAKWSKGSSGPAGDECHNLIAHSLRAEGFDASEDGTGRGTPLVPVAFAQNSRDEVREIGGNIAGSLAAEPDMKQQTYIAFTARAGGHSGSHANAGVMPAVAIPGACDVSPTLCREPGGPGSQDWQIHAAAIQGSAVRRLTPRECERLQGFPDDFTLVPYRGKPAADGPRYKALGNSMAVPVVRWIGERIAAVEAIKVSEAMAA
jgi:DNA (cytosine-5)-methyltransferase 1